MANSPRRIARMATLTITTTLLITLLVSIIASALPVASAKYDIEPSSDVLISEIAAGGAGATSQSNRNGDQNFIELTNYGSGAVDISGWRIFRCGQTGGGYGPQAVVADGTVLAPGAQYTTASETSNYDADSFYETNLHAFGFGAFIENAEGQRQDAIGFYHPDVATDCANNGKWLQGGLQHRLDESHQRVGTSGNLEDDWIIAERTVGEPNRTQTTRTELDNGLRITEVANGGSGSSHDQYVEITNFSDSTVNVDGYQLFRCGENASQYLQVGSLPADDIAPGETYLLADESSTERLNADVTWPTSMHWRDFGVMLLTEDEQIVDRMGVYDNRNSPCTSGAPVHEKANHFANEVQVRVADTGDNFTDFAVSHVRTPGVHEENPKTGRAERSPVESIRISELTAAGPSGGLDEFVEIANYGTEPVTLSGWSAHRCFGTGQPGVGDDVQVPDLGDVTLNSGDTYVMTATGAPDELLTIADSTYETGLNQDEGFGMYISDENGKMVDAVAIYDSSMNNYSPCAQGEEMRHYLKYDEGESATRVEGQNERDNELDFVAAPRTPGQLADTPYVDPTEALPGELDPVSVDTDRMPNTPVATWKDGSGSVSVTDEDGSTVSITGTVAEVRNSSSVQIFAGTTETPEPVELQPAEDERQLAIAQELTTEGTTNAFPYQRFEIPVPDSDDPGEFTWAGTTHSRNEIQLLGWDGEQDAWTQLTWAVPSADGDIVLTAPIPSSSIVDGTAHVMVIDGPRTHGGLLDEINVTDQEFANPGHYDFSINHMTDTQFYAEGFRDVFRKMSTWVVANADSRKIAYNSLTGDIIENWINGNNQHERANREFQAAQDIMTYINDAEIPNGVLPGNHDNMWGHNNDKYNDYFPTEMYSEKPWYGEAWREGDNSAHTDFFNHEGVDFLVISLPYRPSMEQMEWASQQAESHPDHNVVLATHSYLHTSGERDSTDRRYTGNATDMWDLVVAPNDNVFLVIGGHYHGVSTQYADPVTGEQTDAIKIGRDTVAVTNVGATGRTVVEMLADYQGYRSTQIEGDPNATRDDLLDRDTGFQRLLQFDLDASLMAVNAYSPHLQSFEAWKYDEPDFRGASARYGPEDDEFVTHVSINRDLALESSSWTVTAAAEEFTSVEGLPQGVEHTFDLVPTDAERMWLVTATDDDGNVVHSRPQFLVDQPQESPGTHEPEVTESEATEPEPTGPEATGPGATEPEATAPDASKSEAIGPGATGSLPVGPEWDGSEVPDQELTTPDDVTSEKEDPAATRLNMTGSDPNSPESEAGASDTGILSATGASGLISLALIGLSVLGVGAILVLQRRCKKH